MKKTKIALVLLLALIGVLPLPAQKTNIWKGGFPGQETNWSCARNWSLGATPDWNSHVIVPIQLSLKKFYPVISAKNLEIYSLVIESGALLEISTNGELAVTGISPFDVPVYNAGTLRVRGKLDTTKSGDNAMAHHR